MEGHLLEVATDQLLEVATNQLHIATNMASINPVKAEQLARELLITEPIKQQIWFQIQVRRVIVSSLYQRGEYQQALTIIEEAQHLYTNYQSTTEPSLDLELLKADITLSIGQIHANLGYVASALEHHQQAILIFEQHNHQRGIAHALHGVASLCRETKELTRANELVHQSLELMRATNDGAGEAIALVSLGLIANEMGQGQTRIAQLETALNLAKMYHEVRAECLAIANLGWAHIQQGNLEIAEQYFTQTEQRANSIQSRQFLAFALSGFGLICRYKNQYQQALTYAGQALELMEALGLLRGQYIVLEHVTECYETIKDYQAALQTYKQFHALERRILAGEVHRDSLQIAYHLEKILAQRSVEAAVKRSQELEVANAKLRQQTTTLEQTARLDALTKLHNRHVLNQELPRLLEQSKQSNLPVCAIMIDIDDFKKINDIHGHLIGDDVLRTIAQILQANTRPNDLCIRFGGEEFLIVLPNANLEQATIIAERICQAVPAFQWQKLKKNLQITVSIGVSNDDHQDIIAQADNAMYNAKRNGKNQVQTSQAPQLGQTQNGTRLHD